MTNGTPWYRELWTAFVGAFGADVLKDLVRSFTKETGEKVAKNAVEWTTLKIFGPTKEDERRYNEATSGMDRNDVIRLEKKLAVLDSEMQDWFRICNMHDDIEQIRRNLTSIARKTDVAWQRYVKIMNLEKETADSFFQKFMGWLSKAGATIVNATKKTLQAADQVRKDINTEIQNTGIGDVLANARQKLADRVKKQLGL